MVIFLPKCEPDIRWRYLIGGSTLRSSWSLVGLTIHRLPCPSRFPARPQPRILLAPSRPRFPPPGMPAAFFSTSCRPSGSNSSPSNAADYSATENLTDAVNPADRNPDPDRAGPARNFFTAIMIKPPSPFPGNAPPDSGKGRAVGVL